MEKTVKSYFYKAGDASAKSLAEKFHKADTKKVGSINELTSDEWQALIQNRLVTMINKIDE